jgi:DNA-binding response OmpR family regulator
VLAAGALAEAAGLARRQKPPIDLVALTMPDPEGARKLVRTLAAGNDHLCVLAIGDDVSPLPEVPAPLQTALIKPFALSALLRAVRRLLDARPGPSRAPNARDRSSRTSPGGAKRGPAASRRRAS